MNIKACMERITKWLTRGKQTTFCYCKNCRNELCGDPSTVAYDAGSEVHYVCGQCKWQTDFLFDAPVPIYLRSYPPRANHEQIQDATSGDL